MPRLWANNAVSTLAAGIAAGATTLTVPTGEGDRFPVVTAPDTAILTLEDAAGNIEIIQVTARASASDSLTIVRAQEGTTARAWATGDLVELRLTAGAFEGALKALFGTTLTINRVLTSNASGQIIASGTITVTELGYINGVTSNIQTQLNAKLPNTEPVAFRNAVINGDMRINQRGLASYGNSDTYTLDRWICDADGTGGTRAVTQEYLAVGSELEGCFNFLRWNQSVARTGATWNAAYTRIEDVRTFQGKTVTLSFQAKADAAINIAVTLKQNFGSGGSAIVSTTLLASQAITTTLTKYTVSFTVPSISGKTIGTGSAFLELAFFLPTTGTFVFDLTGVQLEPGSVDTPFELRPLSYELARCQRYYQTGQLDTIAVCYQSGYWLTPRVLFPVQMRAAPTMAMTMASHGPTALSGTWAPQPYVNGFRALLASTGTANYIDYIDAVYTASAEL